MSENNNNKIIINDKIKKIIIITFSQTYHYHKKIKYN